MRCLTSEEAETRFERLGLQILPGTGRYRFAFRLDGLSNTEQLQTQGTPESTLTLLEFIEESNRWLPSNASRLLWIGNWEDGYPSVHIGFEALRRGVGENRAISQARGHYFSPHDYANADILSISEEQHSDASILVSLISLVVIGGWDAWLVSDNSFDWVEFCEGNISFHSKDKEKILSAEETMKKFSVTKVSR